LEIKRRTESFARVDFVYKGRQSNFDTHQLAKSSVSLDFVGRHNVWLISPPFGVCNIIGDQKKEGCCFTKKKKIDNAGNFLIAKGQQPSGYKNVSST
jgi:hypothetical protein